jgi:hypothetical protein
MLSWRSSRKAMKPNGQKDTDWKISTVKDEKIIAIRQIIVDSLEIVDCFPTKVWEYCTFTKEEYIERKDIISRKET